MDADDVKFFEKMVYDELLREVNKQYSTTDLEAFMKLAANWQNTTNHNLLEGVDIKGEMQQYLNSPAMNMYKKRERTQNWNHQEKKFLLDLCRKDMRIIENKRLDAGLTAVKNKAWKIIHQKFSNQFGTDRTCNRLKEQWRRMKACTRNEILDYNNRLTRFGPDVADRKKPSPFTFEVWEFMQEAKKACKSEALDGIDYSKIPLALEEDFVFREEDHNNEDEHDIDDSSRTPPQDLCDVDIKEETNEPLNDNYLENDKPNNFSSPSHRAAAAMNHELDRASMHSPTNLSTNDDNNAAPSGANTATFLPQGGSDITGFQPSFNVNNLSATLEALNALRSGQFPTAAAAAAAALQNNFAAAQQQQQHQQQQQQQQQQHHQQQQQLHADTDDQTPPAKRPRTSSLSNGNGCICLSEDMDLPENLNNNNSNTCLNSSNSLTSLHTKNPGFDNNSPEMTAFMEMQNKEHIMRMRILEVQLQAAKYSRDLVEINKTLALQKLQEYASKRLGTT